MNLSKGLCGRTHHNQADCEAGDRGVLPAPLVPATGGWAALARECAGLCRACARCNVVSFSLAERECDWFHDCDPSILKTVDKPWKTLVVNQLQPPPERFVSYYNVPFRSHTAVRWSGSTVRLYIVNDWSAEWVLQESHSEYAVTRIFRRLASDCADRDTLILDVGANSGYYSLLSAALGCQVVAFEPQPGCHTRLKAAIQLNRFHDAMRFVPRPVGLPQGALVDVSVHGCHGAYQLRPNAARPKPASDAQRPVRFTTIQHALSKAERAKRITLVKIDTEGAEGAVLRSLMKHIDRIDNLVVETSPWRWPLVSNMSREMVAELYASLLRPGRFALAHVSSPIAPGEWIDTPETMRHYTGELMPSHYWGQADIWFGRDAALMRTVF